MEKKIEAYQAAVQKGILLNANEGYANLSDEIIQEIAQALPSIHFNRYPDNSQEALLEAYGKVMGISPDQLLAGNGSDQMLGLLIGTYLGKGKKLFTFDPDFSMYDYYASAYEAGVEKFDLKEDGRLDIDAFIAQGRKDKVDLVLFSNPNNPTGHCLSVDEIRKITEAFAPVPVVVDEAYMEFSDEVSALTLINEEKNLYVTRTLSKAYALAGVRVGFMVSSQENMKTMKASAVPYALNSVSMKIAEIVLGHADETKQRIEEIKARRNAFCEKVKDFRRIQMHNSQANFLYGKCADKEKLLEAFDAAGIVIRNYKGKDTFRITIGSEAECQAAYEVLKNFEEI